jgi:hypothetical protein
MKQLQPPIGMSHHCQLVFILSVSLLIMDKSPVCKKNNVRIKNIMNLRSDPLLFRFLIHFVTKAFKRNAFFFFFPPGGLFSI